MLGEFIHEYFIEAITAIGTIIGLGCLLVLLILFVIEIIGGWKD